MSMCLCELSAQDGGKQDPATQEHSAAQRELRTGGRKTEMRRRGRARGYGYPFLTAFLSAGGVGGEYSL